MTDDDEKTSPGGDRPRAPSPDVRDREGDPIPRLERDVKRAIDATNANHREQRKALASTDARMEKVEGRTMALEKRTEEHSRRLDTHDDRHATTTTALARKATDPVIEAKAAADHALRVALRANADILAAKQRAGEEREDLVRGLAAHVSRLVEQGDLNFLTLQEQVARLTNIVEARDRKASSVRWDREAREGLQIAAQAERDAEIKAAVDAAVAAAQSTKHAADVVAERAERERRREFGWKVASVLFWVFQAVVTAIVTWTYAQLGIGQPSTRPPAAPSHHEAPNHALEP